MASTYLVRPVDGPIDASVRLPGSKSITNRALVCAALATGRSTLRGVLFADDTEAMLDSLTRLGVRGSIDRAHEVVTLEGCGGVVPPGPAELDARLSGTTSRFLMAVLALGTGPYVLDGAAPLRERPMADGIEAVTALGAAVIPLGSAGHLPVRIERLAATTTSSGPAEIRIRGDVSSQFLSGLLLAAPCVPGGVIVHVDGELVSRPYVNLTLQVMVRFGAAAAWLDEQTLQIEATGYRSTSYDIEPDASAASYAFAAAAITGGTVRVGGLGSSSLQGDVAFVDALERMGAAVDRQPDSIVVRGPASLRGITADFTHISDTAQTLASVAVFADGPTEITGIGFIRRKETDRLAATVTELRRCGIEADELPDGLRIVPGTPHPAVIQTYDDHRVAMSFALLGLRVPGIEIADPGVVAKTFPDYWRFLEALRFGGTP